MVGLCFSTEAAVIQILFWSYLLPPLECVWHVRTMTPAPAIWYTGKTKAWRERAQLPLLNYFIQNKSHPTGCLEEKTTLSTLAVALDKWCVSKITSWCGARGAWNIGATSTLSLQEDHVAEMDKSFHWLWAPKVFIAWLFAPREGVWAELWCEGRVAHS